MRVHASLLDWKNISQYQRLSETFIIEFQDYLDWEKIAQYQKLSAGFIKDHVHILNMKLVSRHQQLDTGAIEVLKDHLDMKLIFQYQELGENFVREHIREIEDDEDICDAMILNNNISDSIVNSMYRRWVLLMLRNICKKTTNF